MGEKKLYTQKQALMAINSLMNSDVVFSFSNMTGSVKRFSYVEIFDTLDNIQGILKRIYAIVHGIESNCCQKKGLEEIQDTIDIIKRTYKEEEVNKYFKKLINTNVEEKK